MRESPCKQCPTTSYAEATPLIGVSLPCIMCQSLFFQCCELHVVCLYVSMFVLEDEQFCLFHVCRGNLCYYLMSKLPSKVKHKKTFTVMKTLCSMSFSDSPLGFVYLVLCHWGESYVIFMCHSWLEVTNCFYFYINVPKINKVYIWHLCSHHLITLCSLTFASP